MDRFLTKNVPALAITLGAAKRFLVLFALALVCLPITTMGIDCSTIQEWTKASVAGQNPYPVGAEVKYEGKVYRCATSSWENSWSIYPGLAGYTHWWNFVADCDAVPTIPTVNSVTVSPKTSNVIKSKTLVFTANVNVAGGATGAVTWGIVGNANVGTVLSGQSNTGATLTVAADETAASIKVWVKSTEDQTKSDTAVVTISEAPAPTVNSVTISPKPAEAVNGTTLQFSAVVSVEENAPKTVTWSVSGNNSASTQINTTTGLLSVALNETATTLKVKAVSTSNSAKADSVNVAIVAGKIESITVSPKSQTVAKGATLDLTVNVVTSGTFTNDVEWEIIGTVENSTELSNKTNSGATLIIAANETAATIKVRVKSKDVPTKYDEATITVSSTAIAGSITSVEITPKVQSVDVGNTLNLIANVIKTGEYTGSVIWGIVGASASSLSNQSNSGATLNVSTNETAASIKVWVKSTEDLTKSDSATITITASLASVVITPKAASVKKGATLDLTASVLPANAPQGVDWSVAGSDVSKINGGGKLTVPVGETSGEIKVIATSKIDSDKSDTAVITILAANTYRVTIDCGIGGTTNPSEYVDVEEGASVTISFTPNADYEVDGVWVNGNARTKPLAGWAPITINGINSDRTFKVTFKLSTAISNIAKGRNDFGILFKRSSVVSESAEFEVLIPQPAEVAVIIYDNQGNVLFVQKGRTQKDDGANSMKVEWNLTNRGGRSVASGTYIIQATAKSADGTYQYFAPIGVKR